MWDVRKAIIELIWDYMDKSLNEGCLINIWWHNYRKIVKRKWKTKTFLLRYSVDEFDDIREVNLINCPYNIIWHYDITAVLKYIDKTDFTISIYNKEFVIVDYLNSSNRCDEWDRKSVV